MDKYKILPPLSIHKQMTVPGDKSMTHRAYLLTAISSGTNTILNPCDGLDCKATLRALSQLGVAYKATENQTEIEGSGLFLSSRYQVIDCENSGTLARLLSGILAGQAAKNYLIGDASLNKRPMKRIKDPLSQMGARVALNHEQYLPLCIEGQYPLQSIVYESNIASAQVKSCVLFASLYANGACEYKEKIKTRDHTERLFQFMDIPCVTHEGGIKNFPVKKITARDISIPGDFSAAIFWVVAGLIAPNSFIQIDGVGLNPTRIHALSILRKMGAKIEWQIEENLNGNEPVGFIRAYSSALKATTLSALDVALTIDEIPILALSLGLAEGTSTIEGASELKLKESNRLQAVFEGLLQLGVKVKQVDNDLIIQGTPMFQGGVINAYADHRIEMTFTIAALKSHEAIRIHNGGMVSTSYASFFSEAKSLGFQFQEEK